MTDVEHLLIPIDRCSINTERSDCNSWVLTGVMKIEELVDLKDPTERIIKSRYDRFERIIWKMSPMFLVCMYSDQIIHITYSVVLEFGL